LHRDLLVTGILSTHKHDSDGDRHRRCKLRGTYWKCCRRCCRGRSNEVVALVTSWSRATASLRNDWRRYVGRRKNEACRVRSSALPESLEKLSTSRGRQSQGCGQKLRDSSGIDQKKRSKTAEQPRCAAGRRICADREFILCAGERAARNAQGARLHRARGDE